jgi:hypothetical protein
VQEFDADGAAVEAAGLLSKFTGEAFEVGAFQRSEITKGVEIGLVETPAAKEVENAFTLGVSGAVGGYGFFSRLCEFVRN